MTTDPAGPAPAARFAAVTFDCPDPTALAAFYAAALAVPVTYTSDAFVMIGGGNGAAGLGFSRFAEFKPPTWPDPTHAHEKRVHLDLGVDDLDVAQARLVALGATEPAAPQPQPGDWRVLLDPVGHPFCITTLA